MSESKWQERHEGTEDGKSPTFPREGTPAPKTLTKPLEFHPPKGFEPPAADSQKDGKWEMTCTFETLPDGKIRMVMLGDTELPTDSKHENKPKPPTYDAMAQKMMAPMGAGAGAAQPEMS